ncbi:Histone acetyltransferase [Ciborinia camelliae]|nr:Histone acetyltransferase [Ciborinia camelliae]
MALDLDVTPEANDPMDVDEAAAEAANAKNEPAQHFSREEEIEKPLVTFTECGLRNSSIADEGPDRTVRIVETVRKTPKA